VVSCEAGSYLRPKDSFITQLKAQGPSRTCNESKEEEERKVTCGLKSPATAVARRCIASSRPGESRINTGWSSVWIAPLFGRQRWPSWKGTGCYLAPGS